MHKSTFRSIVTCAQKNTKMFKQWKITYTLSFVIENDSIEAIKKMSYKLRMSIREKQLRL